MKDTTKNLTSQVEKMLGRMKEIQTKNSLDLSADEDLSLAIMNLVSIEEHMFFTSQKTGKIEYLDILNEVRELRKKLLKRIIKDYEGEVWCISKHLLAASMRLMEVGTKKLGQGDKKNANDLFTMAYRLYSLFWGLNLGAVESKDLQSDLTKAGFSKNEFADNTQIASQEKGGIFAKLGEMVKKAIDCCRE